MHIVRRIGDFLLRERDRRLHLLLADIPEPRDVSIVATQRDGFILLVNGEAYAEFGPVQVVHSNGIATASQDLTIINPRPVRTTPKETMNANATLASRASSTPEPTREGEIPRELNRLAESLGRTDILLGTLEARLKPVTTGCKPPMAEDAATADAPLAPLACHIRLRREFCDRMNERISNLLSTLELE